jgi:hypothetical protein
MGVCFVFEGRGEGTGSERGKLRLSCGSVGQQALSASCKPVHMSDLFHCGDCCEMLRVCFNGEVNMKCICRIRSSLPAGDTLGHLACLVVVVARNLDV